MVIALPTPRLPLAAQLASRALDVAVALGGWRFDPEALMAWAAEAEGSDDFGPDDTFLREGLAAYCESVERDARPHGLGRFYANRRVCRLGLQARIRLAPHVRAGARPTRAPLIVCGLPRSGTTLLHRLLELADDAAGIPFWQLVDPMPPPRGPDRRRELAQLSLGRLQRVVSLPLDAQHLVRADLADECGHLLRTAYLGAMPWQLPVYGWLDWSMRQDSAPAYRVWAAYLSRLEPPGKRLVLKDPFHAANLLPLLAVCPDAAIVQTHRDPVQVLPSFHKLCSTMHAVLVPALDLARMVEAHMTWLSWLLERNTAARASLPPRRVLDIDYRELVADPIATVGGIHDALGLPMTEEHVQRMRGWLADHGQRSHGENPYTPEAFGQSAAEIAERFQIYRERYGFVQGAA
jgi:hypothetical protein